MTWASTSRPAPNGSVESTMRPDCWHAVEPTTTVGHLEVLRRRRPHPNVRGDTGHAVAWWSCRVGEIDAAASCRGPSAADLNP